VKILKYNLCAKVKRGTEEAPIWEEILSPVEMGWNEANEEIAKREAYKGEYIIEEDGQTEPEAPQTEAERIAELEEALALILSGVTE
jgi:hypothetical protein